MTGAVPRRLRIALIDDHAIVRSGLRRLLALEPDIDVVAEYADGETAYQALATVAVDVAILDLSMPGRDGLTLLQRLKLRQPAFRALVFSMHDSAVMVEQALRVGADGYFSKSSSAPEQLPQALRRIAAGERVIAAELADQSGGGDPRAEQAAADISRLTPREFAVYRAMLDGASVATIAATLHLSSKTVSNHQTAIRQKLGAESAIDLLNKAQAAKLRSRPATGAGG